MSEILPHSPGALPPPVLAEEIARPDQALRRLFLTLFLRGRGARGLNKSSAPKSVGQKLALSLALYAIFGCIALGFQHQPVFALAVYLHAMTFVFLGMFIASSSGEILFNKEEADILLHRPITPRALLWAKIRVLVEVSLWLAIAFNLAGLLMGTGRPGGWVFLLIHSLSLALEAIFCASCVVLLYQLCLRWFGRERLESLMTASQMLVAVGAVLGGQIFPRLIFRPNHLLQMNETSGWIALLPPAWFAGLDDAVAGTAAGLSWGMGGLALLATGLVVWLAFGLLARDYEIGLQNLNETSSSRKPKPGRRRWLDRLIELPPLNWWLREPVSRGAFLLTVAYLTRDRETKLRVYPGMAPMLVFPFIILFQGGRGDESDRLNFMIPFMGIYLGMVPMLGLQILRFSQQWPAADIFQIAPLAGPGNICDGARRAVLLVLAAPVLLLVFGISAYLSQRTGAATLLALLPGFTLLPVFSLIPSVEGKGLPLSQPTDAAKAAGRSLTMFGVMILSAGLSYLTMLAWNGGWFWHFETTLALVAAGIYQLMRRHIRRQTWPSAE